MFKTCSKCKKELPRTIEYFGKNKNKLDGFQYKCKSCIKKYREENKYQIEQSNKQYKEEHKEQIKESRKKYNNEHKEQLKEYSQKYRNRDRELWLAKKYNLTPESYETILFNQDNKCAICGKEFKTGNNKIIHIDHSHITGKVRGILCIKCNLQLGIYEKNTEIFKKMITYLEQNTQ